jgi:ABC-type amino acid transport substrate-binding protein
LGNLRPRPSVQQDRLTVWATSNAKTGISNRLAGPAYNLYWYAVNHNGFKASTWEDYNKPEVKVAAMLGSADVVILQKVAPRATRIELNDVAPTALAVSSGRADAMVTAVFGALVAKNRNPDLGDFVLRTPTVYLPSYVGLRREDNNTLQKFLRQKPSPEGGQRIPSRSPRRPAVARNRWFCPGALGVS